MTAAEIQVSGVAGLPEVRPGDDLAQLIASAADLRDGDVLVVAQKVVSKAEGRVRSLAEVEPGEQARRYAETLAGDARVLQVILDACRVGWFGDRHDRLLRCAAARI